MSYWVDIKGHPNFKVNSDYLPRVGETFIIGPDTFEGQEGDLAYEVLCVYHRIELGLPSDESPLIVLESRLNPNTPSKGR